MFKKIGNRLKGDRKYFAIVFFIFILILAVGLIVPSLESDKINSWKDDLKVEVQKIETETIRTFREKEKTLIDIKDDIKSGLVNTLGRSDYTYKELINLVVNPEFGQVSIELVAPNGKLIAWNDVVPVSQREIFPLRYSIGESYFHNSGILTYLTITDTINIQYDIFYVLVSIPFEKHYYLQNQFYEEINFTSLLSDNFDTQFKVQYDQYAQPSKDGREHSFSLLNLNGTKIGLITFSKPLVNVAVAEIGEIAVKIQSLLIVTGLIFLGLAFRTDLALIKYRTLKLFFILVYFALCRLILFWMNFPSTILEGPLTDPAYFSSIFAGGLVKSPIEFLITNIFLVLVALLILKYISEFVSDGVTEKYLKLKLILTILSIVLFIYVLRGLSASIKSVIYDSSIRYFKEPELLPDLPALVMNLNVLLIGFATVSVMIAIILLASSIWDIRLKSKIKTFLILFFVCLLSGTIFYFFHRDPLISILLIELIICLIFFLLYLSYFRHTRIPVLILYVFIVSSIITISLQNYFNLQLERGSLKTVAYEINRANEDLLHLLVDETLKNSVKDKSFADLFFSRNVNYDAEAFILWSKSSLQREALNSQVVLFDRSRKVLGKFTVAFNDELNFFDYFRNVDNQIPSVTEIKTQGEQQSKKFVGIIPVYQDEIISGYIGVAAEFTVEKIGGDEYPDFLKSSRAILGSVIDLSLINVFEFIDGRVSQVYGNIFPSRDQSEQILYAQLADDFEGWTNISINTENFLTFIFKQTTGGREKVTAVAVKEKEISWNLFNFFKIFIVHSIFILLLFFTIVLFQYIRVQYTFRTKLLIAFLLVSIIPIIILAIYNRQVAQERSHAEIFNELNKRSNYLENHIISQLSKHKDRELKTAFENAAKELGISFVVYKTSDQIYSSRVEFFQTGLFSAKLNPIAHYNLNYLSYREFLTQEKVNYYRFDAFYKKINVGSESLIIGVNDAFNKIELAYSTVDFDVLLFGTYSFALLIIIIISTLFAGQISAPIRRLTKATEAVAQGDLNIHLQNNEKGELKDLYDGFNLMTKELQRNQAEIAELERETAWKEMAKQVAHEIKNPLTPMKLAIQQIVAAYNDKKDGFESILKKLSQSVLTQIESLSQIATEFSSFAKMPSTRIEKFDIVEVVNDIINLFADESTDISIKSEMDPIEVEADQSQFRRMIINMIRNSIQAGAGKIQINISTNSGKININIEDNGSGIPSELQNKIFELNFTTKDKGMGLGLKLTKRVLEQIGGEIRLLQSSAGKTEFLLTIPYSKIKKTSQEN